MEKGAGRKRLAARRRVLVEWGTESRRTFLDSSGRSAMGMGSERRGGGGAEKMSVSKILRAFAWG